MRAALTCSAMKPVNTTRKNSGTGICQPLPLDFSIHNMTPADTGPASSQYQLAQTSRKREASLGSVPAVTSNIIPCGASGRSTWGPYHGTDQRGRIIESPGEVLVRVATVQQEHPPGDQHRTGDAGNATRYGEHGWPGHREEPDSDVDEGGDAAAGQYVAGPPVTGAHQDQEGHDDRAQHRGEKPRCEVERRRSVTARRADHVGDVTDHHQRQSHQPQPKAGVDVDRPVLRLGAAGV